MPLTTRPSGASENELSMRSHADGLTDYSVQGEARLHTLDIRGPVRYGPDGRLHSDILEVYAKHGCYIFEGLVAPDEIASLQQDIATLLDRAPSGRGEPLDAKGRPAFGTEFAVPVYHFIEPLSDPWGGTSILNGRHPTKMAQPQPQKGSPAQVVHLMSGMCQTMSSGLELYGHPDLLAIAAAINGDDFVPYNDAIFVKLPYLGGSVSWHQDGVTHWDASYWDEGIHGFNFQVQLYPCTSRNCLWVIPASHRSGKLDIKSLVHENGGSEQLPGAVPLICQPGDVTVVNRQMLHASFANTSPDQRVSLTFGFHRRSSVLGQSGSLSQAASEVYDEQRIFERSAVIAVAIDARSKRYPEEKAYCYRPFTGLENDYRFTEENIATVIKDYNLKDLSI